MRSYMAINLRIPYKAENFLTSLATTSFLSTILLYGVSAVFIAYREGRH